ncbi:hypothetical protein PHMEG_00018929 [Phytophthora megakarya]|uniref:Uncharacterized protein n=1 Tax=Phytophthora megakarya TaxID=4795 RepID=A0A225VT51_9STRA|nr:hypothetical protein PHMEG_00018929 [Phytophthora megakarya]
MMLQAIVHAKMQVYFNKRFMGFVFTHTQRCYTISHCWNDHSMNSEWRGLPKSAHMVWYEGDYCAGAFEVKNGPKGSIDFSNSRLYNRVSSFMVGENGLYATDGMVDHCHENSTLNTTNSGSFYVALDNVTDRR